MEADVEADGAHGGRAGGERVGGAAAGAAGAGGAGVAAARRPASVLLAVADTVVLAVLLGVVAVLTLVRNDDLVLAWAEGDDAAGPLVDEGGLRALEASALTVPAFWPVALACAVLFAAAAGVLVGFLLDGAAWARTALTGLAVVLAVIGALSLRSDPPTVFVVLGATWLALDGLLVALLWHPATSAHLAGR